MRANERKCADGGRKLKNIRARRGGQFVGKLVGLKYCEGVVFCVALKAGVIVFNFDCQQR